MRLAPFGMLGVLVALAGCGERWHGGSSVSYGRTNAGTILEPVRLATRGEGFYMPMEWANRGLHFGTDELIGMVHYLGRELSRQMPGRRLAVADLSLREGGPSQWHRSHQTGRDIDLIYFARDDSGRPIEPSAMRHFGPDGKTTEPGLPGLQFDDEANWRLIKSLITSPVAEVQWIFMAEWLEDRVIDYAHKSGEPLGVILAAAVLLHEPSNVQNHDDHLHIRFLCDPDDVKLGCIEVPPFRWYRLNYKYRAAQRRQAIGPLAEAINPGLRALGWAAVSRVPIRGFVGR